ncbi:MAG: metallophosphoesterase [Opitutales bacterium]|nr:metallophosphoesterase [Opitutales bacterium]
MQRRKFLAIMGSLMAAGIFALGGSWWRATRWSPFTVQVERYQLGLSGLPSEFVNTRIAQISDLHLSDIVPAEYLQTCIDKVMAERPEAIFLTGDFLTAAPGHQRGQVFETYGASLQKLLRQLAAPLGVWACWGNHDISVGPGRMAQLLEDSGVRVLRDAWTRLRFPGGTQELAIGGLRDGLEFPNPKRAFEDLPEGEPILLLMHQPDLFEEWEGPENALIFAGHLHGGQVNLPGITSHFVPSEYGDKYLSGVFRKGSRTMLVNRGLGVIRHRIRFRSPPEISLVSLSLSEG